MVHEEQLLPELVAEILPYNWNASNAKVFHQARQFAMTRHDQF
jgi:hypothetical protein